MMRTRDARIALIELRGAGGEPVDLRRTLGSHGVAELPPMAIDADGLGAAVTLATPEGPRTVRLEAAGDEGADAADAAGGAGRTGAAARGDRRRRRAAAGRSRRGGPHGGRGAHVLPRATT